MDTDTAIAVLAPIPYSTGTVLMIVLSTVWLLVTDMVLGAMAIAVFPLLLATNVVYQRRVDQHFDAAQAELGRLSASVHESFEGVQLVKAYGAEQRETHRLSEIAGRVRDSRLPRSGCGGRSMQCSTCFRRWPTWRSSSSAPTGSRAATSASAS